jgi:hypothetical protein
MCLSVRVYLYACNHVHMCYNTVTCRMVHVTNNYGIRRLIGFITTSVTLAHLITIIYRQYSAIADLHPYNSPLLTH